jgi:hypothetical protein
VHLLGTGNGDAYSFRDRQRGDRQRGRGTGNGDAGPATGTRGPATGTRTVFGPGNERGRVQFSGGEMNGDAYSFRGRAEHSRRGKRASRITRHLGRLERSSV